MTVHLKLKHKLFLIILSANLLLCFVIIGLVWKDFNKDFKNYRVKADLKQTQQVEELIVEQYNLTGKVSINKKFWRMVGAIYRPRVGASIEDNMLITRLVIGVDNKLYSVENELNFPPASDRPKLEPNGKERNPANKERRPQRDLHKLLAQNDITWKNIKVDGQRIARVGIISNSNLMARADQNFVNQQKDNFILSLGAAVIISILIGFIGARIFSKPIDRLSKATQTLNKGDYNIEPVVKGNDEIAQLGRDLYILSQTLSSNLQSKNQWIADISHELRTPVAVIKAQIEAMLDGIRKPTDENLGIFANQIDDLSKLINDLHELSMSDLGALNYQFNDMDLSQTLSNVLNEQPLYEFEITTDVQEDLNIFADQRRIEQLFRNLVQNSIKYTDAPGKLLLEAKYEQDKTIINWHDSGPGVSDEQLEKLFERLYRAENSRNRTTGGSGLGLSICQNIVNAHQGSITASHSELGGIKISIEFPREIKNG